MDSILLSANRKVIEGLNAMSQNMLGIVNGYLDSAYVELPEALFIIELARRAEDRDEWFPHGKWATIQAIEERTYRELDKLKREIRHGEE